MDDARQLLKNIDETLGQALPEKDYGDNCRTYDDDQPDDPYHNLWVCLSLSLSKDTRLPPRI